MERSLEEDNRKETNSALVKQMTEEEKNKRLEKMNLQNKEEENKLKISQMTQEDNIDIV